MSQRPEMLNQKHDSKVAVVIFSLLCLLIAFFVIFELWFSANYFVVEVKGDSMMNTVFDKDLIYARRNFTAERGDIVIIDVTDYDDVFTGKHIIKRLIGKEGDTVSCTMGVVSVQRKGEEAVRLEERYAIGVTEDFGPVTVGEGEIFFLGDNRTVSKDSHFKEVGCLLYSDIVGVVPQWAVDIRNFSTGWEGFRNSLRGLFA